MEQSLGSSYKPSYSWFTLMHIHAQRCHRVYGVPGLTKVNLGHSARCNLQSKTSLRAFHADTSTSVTHRAKARSSGRNGGKSSRRPPLQEETSWSPSDKRTLHLERYNALLQSGQLHRCVQQLQQYHAQNSMQATHKTHLIQPLDGTLAAETPSNLKTETLVTAPDLTTENDDYKELAVSSLQHTVVDLPKSGADVNNQNPSTNKCSQQLSPYQAFATPEAKQALFDKLRGKHKAFFRSCLHRGQLDLVVQYLHMLPADPRMFTALMTECAQQKRLQELLTVIEVRQDLGLPRDSYSYAALVRAAAGLHDLLRAREFFMEAVDEGVANTVLCNILLDAYSRRADYAATCEVYRSMQQYNIPADTLTYNALLRAAGAAQQTQHVTRLLTTMVKQGPPPDCYTYTILFKAVASAAPQAYDADSIIQAYHGMAQQGVQVNEHVLTSFLAAAGQLPMASHQLESVFLIVANARGRGEVTAAVYAALLTLCIKQGVPERAADVWEAIQEDGIACNGRVFSALFSAAAMAGPESEVEDMVTRANHQLNLHAHKISKTRGNREETASLVVAYNALLNCYAKFGDITEATAVFNSMQAAGHAPDEISYNTLISAHGHVGDVEAAFDTFLRLKASGLPVTPRTYTNLIHGCAQAGRRDVALHVLQLMKEDNVPPNVQTYTALIHACVKEGNADLLDVSFSILHQMRSMGLAPTAFTYGCLLTACEVAQDVETAFALYKQACAEGVLPTDECHNVLIKVCIQANRLEEALDLVKSLARAHGSMQQHMLNSLIRALSVSYIERAVRIVALMRMRRMEPNRATYLALVHGAAKASFGDTAKALYQQLRGQRYEINSVAGSALIECLCTANDVTGAMEVYAHMMKAAKGVMGTWKPGGPSSIASHQRGIPKRTALPTVSAVAALCSAHAAQGNLHEALRFFSMIKAEEGKVTDLILSHRHMWETLIETCCRKGAVGDALEVFDTWKAGCLLLLKSHAQSQRPLPRHPKLSNVTLAFLESCCRRHPAHEWRVYDVCAVMRQAKEHKTQAALARPVKRSHHFLDENTA